MTIPYVESIARRPGAEHWTIHGLSKLRGWLGALIAEWGMWCDIRATQFTLDDMSEAQLEDIGMSRISRRARWVDCRESALGIDFEYRSALGDGQREGGSHV